MKKLQTKRCPKRGKKENLCRHHAKNKKFFALFFAIIAVATICTLYVFTTPKQSSINSSPNREELVKKSFFNALGSLPSEDVKTHYLTLIQKGKLPLKFQAIPSSMPPAMYNLEEHYLLVNTASFAWDGSVEDIWCVLVHENQHILQHQNHKVSLIVLPTFEQQGKEIWNDELDANKAEILLAYSHDFFSKVYPEYMPLLKSNLTIDEIIYMMTLETLERQNFYRPFKAQFVKIFNEEIVPQHPHLHPVRLSN